MMPSQDKLKELTKCGLFTAIALTIFMIESRIPLPIPIPGAKLGLANAVTLYVVYTMGVAAAAKVLFCRIILGGIFAGQMLTLMYSATGGFFCLVFLIFAKKSTTWKQIWFISPLCAIAHNTGQVMLASYVMGTDAILYFLPYLILLALVSGLFVGLATQQLVARTERSGHGTERKF